MNKDYIAFEYLKKFKAIFDDYKSGATFTDCFQDFLRAYEDWKVETGNAKD